MDGNAHQVSLLFLNAGEVTVTQWCTVMLKHAGQNLPWRILRYSLVKPSPTRPKTHVLYMSMFDPKHEIFSDSIVSLLVASADAVSSVNRLDCRVLRAPEGHPIRSRNIHNLVSHKVFKIGTLSVSKILHISTYPSCKNVFEMPTREL